MDKKIDTVGLFVPCCIDQFAPDCAWRALRLLEGLGLQCHYPSELTCCGRHLYLQGDKNGAKALGEKLIEAFDECTYVVSLSSACVVYIQQHFAQLFHNTTLHNSYRQFSDKCLDLSDFLVNVMHYTPTATFAHKVTFMDHCTTMRDYRCLAHPDRLGLREEPRQLLRAVKALTLTEMEQNDVCCGQGGTFANDFTPISDSLTKRKIDNALAAGADYIVGTEPGCLMHLQSYIDKSGLALKCLNLIDVLTSEE